MKKISNLTYTSFQTFDLFRVLKKVIFLKLVEVWEGLASTIVKCHKVSPVLYTVMSIVKC